ncbi:hypothetical protein PM082_001985 [Marasmius tenuissimus]|nr:hypothetical protein PM082_001985 [Marasmius tenuissimus]
MADFSDARGGPYTPPPEYLPPAPFGMEGVDRSAAEGWRYGEKPETHLTPTAETTKEEAEDTTPPPKKKGFLGWWKLNKQDKAAQGEKRKHVLLGPLYAGIGAGLSLYFVTAGIATLIEEWVLDGDATRFALVVVLPVIFCVSLFFCLQLVGNISLIFGPVSQYHENSVYYSAIKPAPNPEVDRNLPHITIQLPVYKESLELTIGPSIMSIKAAMQTYARQGGSSAIFVCDDGLQLVSEADRQERMEFYARHNIGWVARPKHDSKEGGFKRPGKFKKASNMNYALTLSMKLERHLARLIEEKEERERAYNENGSEGAPPSLEEDDESLEDKAMKLAIEEVYQESGNRFKPWASNGKSLRVGEIILIIDADTIVPEDCFRDAAREMAASEELAIIQHESDVMQVAHHYFENGITHFTRRINKCISYGCANGEVAPFVGHNAFLRWSAVQDASFIDENDSNYSGNCAILKEQASSPTFEPPPPERKMWSESNVSEDFDLALRLLLKGYTLRWATYSNGGFKEGVSLTVVDELARWQKYAYGCDEIIFNPLIQWWRKGPISKQLSGFMMSKAPVHYKIGMSSYIYHLARTRDRAAIRVLVYGVYILLVVQVVMCGQDGFERFASASHSPLNGIGLGWFFIPILGGLVTLGVQTFYAWRISILSESRIGPFFMVALSVLSAAAAFASGTFGATVKSVQQVGSTSGLRISTAIWYTTSAACDLIIAVYMCYLLTRGPSTGVESTRRVIGRIIRLTVETNALTAAIAVTAVGLLLGQRDQTYYTLFSLILPSIYGNTLMIMMNLRLKFSSVSTSNNTITISNASFGPNLSQLCTHCGSQTTQSHARMPLSPRVSYHDQLLATKTVQSDSSDYPMQDIRRNGPC